MSKITFSGKKLYFEQNISKFVKAMF